MTSQRQVIEILKMQIEGVPITTIAAQYGLSKGTHLSTHEQARKQEAEATDD